MKLALYRKYRPTKLSDVIGEPQVTEILEHAVEQNQFGHAYLFTGQRGTGKTTVARILAHLINGLDYDDNIESNDIDIIEIDAASNNGVDDIRGLRDSINLAPIHSSHKIYIIDEFHMLSKPAFNALLKTIEEPPEHAVFILATTELQKVPATILSRVQRFHFKPVATKTLSDHLGFIAKQEGIKIDKDALDAIASSGEGSVRDCITILDQLSSSSEKITVDQVNYVLGIVPAETISSIVVALVDGNTKEVVKKLQDMLDDGVNPITLARQLINQLSQAATKQPKLYGTIDQLLEIGKSTMPSIKLIAVMANSSIANQTISARPKLNSSNAADYKVSAVRVNAVSDITIEAPLNTVAVKSENSTPTSHQANNIKSSKPSGSIIENFSWQDLIKQVASMDEPATYSLLKFADYRYSTSENSLTLFFPRAFHRKKANTNKFRTEVTEAINKLYDTTIGITISSQVAPADSAIAETVNAMGGDVKPIPINDEIATVFQSDNAEDKPDGGKT